MALFYKNRDRIGENNFWCNNAILKNKIIGYWQKK